jgi:glutamate/tyrosine decarboxylase-like PLP-dependent enzyme
MFHNLKKDLEDIDQLLSSTKDKALHFLNNLDNLPVSHSTPEPQKNQLPENGTGLEQTLDLFAQEYENKMVAAPGPRYWGYVVGGTTPASIAGDWLTTVYDQNPQTVNAGGDVSACIELQTIDWLLELFNLPKTFKGGFVTGATMSNFTCLAVGRQWAGKKNNNNIARDGIHTEIKILTATPHSSALKSLSMLGLGSNNIIKVATIEGNREAMDMVDLEAKLIENKGFPILLISSAGTVNTVDFDDMNRISQLHSQYDFFWHVDAAFGAFAACSDDYKYLVNGWELADSITFDCHKWLNVPNDSAVYLVSEKHAALQLQTFQNSNAPYLGDPSENFNYLNSGPENSRRFRALPAWFSLNAYGRDGYRWIVENNIRLAVQFGGQLEEKTIFKLAAPVRLNVVCFTTKSDYGQSDTLKRVVDNLNKSHKVFVTPTTYKGTACLRAAFVNWRTTEEDINLAIQELIAAS